MASHFYLGFRNYENLPLTAFFAAYHHLPISEYIDKQAADVLESVCIGAAAFVVLRSSRQSVLRIALFIKNLLAGVCRLQLF